MIERLHGALAGYFERHQLTLPQERSDGALVLSVDNKFRVYCRPAPFGDLVLEAMLTEIPRNSRESEELLKIALMASHVRMNSHADYPVIPPGGSVLLLHQRLPADASVDEFEGSLENFINSIAEWRRIFRIL